MLVRRLIRVTVASMLLFAAAATGTAYSAEAEGMQVKVLSSRADLVSGGDALVEIVLPSNTDPAKIRVDVAGRNLTSAFAVRSDGRFLGLVTGAGVGEVGERSPAHAHVGDLLARDPARVDGLRGLVAEHLAVGENVLTAHGPGVLHWASCAGPRPFSSVAQTQGCTCGPANIGPPTGWLVIVSWAPPTPSTSPTRNGNASGRSSPQACVTTAYLASHNSRRSRG